MRDWILIYMLMIMAAAGVCAIIHDRITKYTGRAQKVWDYMMRTGHGIEKKVPEREPGNHE